MSSIYADVGQSGAESTSSKPAEKFIIVETNFRVYAYTTNKIYKEILKLFVDS